MSKRVLIVGQHFWPESFRINDIADFLAHDKGYEVEVLCGLPNYPSGKFPEGYGYFKNRSQTHKGVRIRRVFEIPRGNNSNLRIFLNYVSFPFASLFHVPRLLTKKYDKIFIYQLSPVMMSVAGIIVGKLTRTETTMYVLDLWPENLYSVITIKNPVLRKIAESVSHWHYRHVDKLIVLSDTMKNRLAKVTKLPSNRIAVLPQTCEKEYETLLHDNALHERLKDKFAIVFTGNISPAQSFDTIIRAASLLKNDGYDDVHWIVVGDGMSRIDVEKQVHEKGLSDRFSFEGHHPISDMPKYMERADALVGCLVKSDLLGATIPAKIVSYMASGRPLLISMDGEAQRLVVQSQSGYASEAEDYEGLAMNVKKLYGLTSRERNMLGKNAKGYYLQHLERNIVLENMDNFIFNTPKV